MKIEPSRHKELERALHHPFRAVAFDIDGTLTKLSRFLIPNFMKEALVGIPPNIPRAVCTGRPLKYIQMQLENVAAHSKDPEAELARWWIFGENGGIGYHWDKGKKEFVPFYDLPWPEKACTQDALEELIKKHYGWTVVLKQRPYSFIVRFHDWVYLFPRLTRRLSRYANHRLQHLLQSEKLDRHFAVKDSGIGNIILPKVSGKGHAMQRWAKALKIPLRDILVVGDQPGPSQNDEDFLTGHAGTAFTVGGLTENLYPLPVLGSRGQHLRGPEGTSALLKRVEWGN